MIYKAAIFDMDGTLVDTLEDLADSVNEMLAIYNFPQRTLEEVRKFVGSGARKLLERALPVEKSADKNFVDKALATYDECYSRHLLNKSKPYAGIMELLTQLQTKKILPRRLLQKKFCRQLNFKKFLVMKKICRANRIQLAYLKLQKVFQSNLKKLHISEILQLICRQRITQDF